MDRKPSSKDLMMYEFPTDDTENEYQAMIKGLLAACDWTQLPDSPADKETWATYRQALRDLNHHPDWPNVLLPDMP
jgi:hypothetical protein